MCPVERSTPFEDFDAFDAFDDFDDFAGFEGAALVVEPDVAPMRRAAGRARPGRAGGPGAPPLRTLQLGGDGDLLRLGGLVGRGRVGRTAVRAPGAAWRTGALRSSRSRC